MNSDFGENEQALWKSYAKSKGPSIHGRCLTPEEMAAYVDHAFSKREEEGIEGHLTDCAECLKGFQAVRVLTRQSHLNVPGVVIQKAKSLLSEPVFQIQEERTGLMTFIRLFFKKPWELAISLAFILTVSTGGLTLGQYAYSSIEEIASGSILSGSLDLPDLLGLKLAEEI